MSDTTSLSSHYSATAEFAKAINAAVLTLKRRHLAPDALPRPSAEEEVEARRTLGECLRGVLAELAPGGAGPGSPGERVPEGVISRLAEKNRDRMDWFVDDLRQVEQSLAGTAAPGQFEFETLDQVCDAADATASASFRRLWRR